tara:strand:+ start:36 stop:797 length:762 start_codon:yes stop_codon:yes gene_type:complete
MQNKRRDLERSAILMKSIKNPSFLMERNEIEKTSMPMEKIKPKPAQSINTPSSSRQVKKAPYIEPTVAQNKKKFEFEKRARKNAPTFNEMTTKVKLGINKGAQKVASITKVKIADKAREIFAPNTTVKREYANKNRVNLSDGSKLGDKKTVKKLDKDGTVLKSKTKQVVSKKSNDVGKSGYVSINKSKKSRFSDEGVEGFSNKKTRYRATRNKESKDFLKVLGANIGGLVLGATGLSHSQKNKAKRASMRSGI